MIEATYAEIIEETDKMQEHLASLRTQLEAKRKTREKSADK